LGNFAQWPVICFLVKKYVLVSKCLLISKSNLSDDDLEGYSENSSFFEDDKSVKKG